jgi:hypothetical protein
MRMTATRTCVANSGALGRRYVVSCEQHGRLSLPIDGETAKDLVKSHNGSLHSTVPAILKAVES